MKEQMKTMPASLSRLAYSHIAYSLRARKKSF